MPIVNLLTVRSWWDLHNSMLGLVLGLATTGAVTQVVKASCNSRSTPSRCDCAVQADPGSEDHAVYGLVTTAICQETDAYMMKDGWRSFFSGHSSLAFAGLGFLSFYLSGKLHLFDERGHTGKAWIALTPLTGALLVAVSRTMDYRHHWQDVLVGSCIGLVFAYFAYRQYYPTLESPYSHKPYSPRIPRDEYNRESMLPIVRDPRHDDEEYAPSVINKTGPGAYNRRTGNASSGSYSPVGLDEYPRSQGHGLGEYRPQTEYPTRHAAPSGSGSGTTLRPDGPYEEGATVPVGETVPRHSGEPLFEMHGRA
ncbi:phosphatidate phosphatase PPAPDC1A [Ceratobasidium sp. AG-Ba]|nr:phosphatidate phosphatase PPAPDC1A [Ceratobasidium sp. AG-Ba]